jgi:hypothetical protein
MFHLLSFWGCAGCFSLGQPSKVLFVARPLTAEGSFTRAIEGPACDAAGNVGDANMGLDRAAEAEESHKWARCPPDVTNVCKRRPSRRFPLRCPSLVVLGQSTERLTADDIRRTEIV